MTTISIEVDNEVAYKFLQASTDEKRKWQFLVNLRLKEIISNPNDSLMKIMNEMSNYAEAKGMTSELLETLLNER